MKFSIGDPVYIKTTHEEGVITAFIGSDMAQVKVNAGNYHAFLSDLEHPYLRWFLKSNEQKKKHQPHIDQIRVEKGFVKQYALPVGIYFSIFPIYEPDDFDEKIVKAKLYLINQTDNTYQFEYFCKYQGDVEFELVNELRQKQEFYLHDIEFEKLAHSPFFYFRLKDEFNVALDNEFDWILKPKKLFHELEKLKFDNKAMFHHLLCQQLQMRPKKEVELSSFAFADKQIKKENIHFDFEHALKKTKYEIDLHIEKLHTQAHILGKTEKLHIQLKAFQQALDLALATKQNTIVFIHGVGKGILKNEIHQILNQTKHVKRYVNDFDVRYGYGATEVFFEY